MRACAGANLLAALRVRVSRAVARHRGVREARLAGHVLLARVRALPGAVSQALLVSGGHCRLVGGRLLQQTLGFLERSLLLAASSRARIHVVHIEFAVRLDLLDVRLDLGLTLGFLERSLLLA